MCLVVSTAILESTSRGGNDELEHSKYSNCFYYFTHKCTLQNKFYTSQFGFVKI